jgi:hypothetical protein
MSTTYQSRYQKKQPSVIGLIATTVGIILIAFFGMLTLSTGDALWFWPVFTETPDEITVQCYGKTVNLTSSDTHFAEITTLFNQNLSGYKNWDSLSISDETYAAYQGDANMMVLFITYPQAVRVHSLYKYFSNVDTLVVPLDGRHAHTNAVFGLNSGLATAGSLHIATTAPLSHYLNTSGLCTPPLNAN